MFETDRGRLSKSSETELCLEFWRGWSEAPAWTNLQVMPAQHVKSYSLLPGALGFAWKTAQVIKFAVRLYWGFWQEFDYKKWKNQIFDDRWVSYS